MSERPHHFQIETPVGGYKIFHQQEDESEESSDAYNEASIKKEEAMKIALKNINERMKRANQDPDESEEMPNGFDHMKDRSNLFKIETPIGAVNIFHQ